MSTTTVVEVSFKFLSEMLGENFVFSAEVDNLAGVVRLLVDEPGEHVMPVGIRPSTARRYHEFGDNFTVLRYPGQPPAFIWKGRKL